MNLDRKLDLLIIQQLEAFIDVWWMTWLCHAPGIHPLEVATALENVAQKIRKEQADKAKEDYWEGYMDGH